MSHAIQVEPTLPAPPTHPTGLGGLLALINNAQTPLPLQEVRVRARITGPVCRTVIEQRFANPYDHPLEVVHIFPLPEDGAVTEMKLVAGDCAVRATCKERKEAEAEFATAREAGHRAALLTAERADVHTLRATNIPAGEEVRVRIVVVEALDAVDGRWRWRFPTTLAPRFLTGTPISHAGPGVLPDTDAVPDASRLQPPIRLEGGTRLDLEVELAGPISTVESTLHAVRMSLDGGGVRVAPSATATLDRDFVLAFATGEAERPAARAWTDGSYTVVSVEPPTAAFPDPLPRDAVFVVDISGSMRGRKMDAAKQALTTALHGLDSGDRFQLIAFDDRIERFSAELVPYDGVALARADAWIAALDARGGTVMAPALQAALAGERPTGRLRTVLFVTDGQAHNQAELTALVAGRRDGARVFTMGIDTAVHGALLKALARVGGGTCELLTPRDDIEARVASLEARFGSPLLTGLTAPGAARPEPAAVFTGRPARLLVEGGAAGVTLTALGTDGPVTFTVVPERVSDSLGPAWARERVSALEDRLHTRPFEEEAIRSEVLRIALAHGIASRWTAFVAVESSRTVTGERVDVVQPAELPADWDRSFASPPAAAKGLRRRSMPRHMPMPASAPPPAPAPMMAAMAPMAECDDDAEEASAPFDAAPSGAMGMVNRMLGRGGPRADAPRGRPTRKAKASSSRQAPPKPPPAEPGARLAAAQSADGSFG
ncbi:MAG: Ca-activated chloride channel family protein, partial [Myxococcota bacterium]